MRYVVESWDPAYGSPVRDHDLDLSTRPVDMGVEFDLGAWRPVAPDPGAGSVDVVTFVDGVRRIDARIWIGEPDGGSRPGVCASVAAGAVRCRPAKAEIAAVIVERGLYTASEHGETLDNPNGIGSSYRLRTVADDTDEALYLGVHTHMTAIEAELAHELDEPGLIVFDGPLGHRDGVNAVGYIKTQHVNYLEPEQRTVVVRLGPGERTPLFHIGGQWPTWSWYLRLPGPISHGMSGIVRLELPALGDVGSAIERADVVVSALPRFASEAHKDPRAPQNLYPISGLERQLRRRLGDAKLLERALRRAAA